MFIVVDDIIKCIINMVNMTQQEKAHLTTTTYVNRVFYSSDHHFVPENCLSQWYVDDTKVLKSLELHNQLEVIAKTNKDLLSIQNWCSSNQRLLNPVKTKLVIFSSQKMSTKVSDFKQ